MVMLVPSIHVTLTLGVLRLQFDVKMRIPAQSMSVIPSRVASLHRSNALRVKCATPILAYAGKGMLGLSGGRLMLGLFHRTRSTNVATKTDMNARTIRWVIDLYMLEIDCNANSVND